MGNLFFSGEEVEVDAAKRICLPCGMRRACLEAALDRREACGVWGGEVVRDGAVVTFRRRGRPKVERLPTSV